jgi:hypothetical protein
LSRASRHDLGTCCTYIETVTKAFMDKSLKTTSKYPFQLFPFFFGYGSQGHCRWEMTALAVSLLTSTIYFSATPLLLADSVPA